MIQFILGIFTGVIISLFILAYLESKVKKTDAELIYRLTKENLEMQNDLDEMMDRMNELNKISNTQLMPYPNYPSKKWSKKLI